MSAFFNLGSFVLGIISWMIPVSLMLLPKSKNNAVLGLSMTSFTCCGAALILQLFEIRNRVLLGDWTAIMDTIDLICWAAVGLTVVTVILNAVALKKKSNQ